MIERQLEELLAEPISDDEVRTLLERLGAAEFGGPDIARVGDLIEATDADPGLVARLLGEIRHEDYQERFGVRLDRVERRLAAVERRSENEPPVIARPPSARLLDEDEASVAALREESTSRSTAMAIAGLLLFLFLCALVLARLAPTSLAGPPTRVEGVNAGGVTIWRMSDGSYVTVERTGLERPATPQEIGRFDRSGPSGSR